MRRLTRSTFLLIASACLALGPASVRSATARHDAGHAHAALSLRVLTPASTPIRNIARPSQWRYRIKSVLEETDLRTFQPVDLGPAQSPDRPDASNPAQQGPIDSLPLIPLRC